jgi:hypothetical protein
LIVPRGESPLQSETPQGTLDMLVLRVLVMGPAHGHTIAHAIERGSEDVLQIEHGSLTRPFTGWKTAAGSRPSGARPTTTGR